MNTNTQAMRHAHNHAHRIYVRTDRLFVVLMTIQFITAIGAAFYISPRAWDGNSSYTHIHTIAAVVIGSLLAGLPISMVLRNPGAKINQYVISAAQLAFSGLFIHLTNGRIETHFHVFGSMAFIAFYRDWKVLVPATLVTAVDHFARAIFWPESIFGIITAAPWRAIEHAGWVIFENIFLAYSCVVGTKEINIIAERRADLEQANEKIEHTVQQRTLELEQAMISLNHEMDDRSKMEQQLAEAQKLESIGQLAAGIAHEINTPAQYVGDNTRFLKGEFVQILSVIDSYAAQLDTSGPSISWEERSAQIKESLKELDYDFIRDEIPQAIDQSIEGIEGIERISHIVKAMKEFSHPGKGTMEPANLNDAIESTATVCSNRWKYTADIEYSLDPAHDSVSCFLGEFNQVILNLIVNAADAIESNTALDGKKGHIFIETKSLEDSFQIRVCDNGGGIPDSVKAKIFDPFFTTKDVGKGTGQGLSISHDVIVNKHHGKLECESELGVGSTFTVTLPRTIQPASVPLGDDDDTQESEAA